jgi:hypothetical protein
MEQVPIFGPICGWALVPLRVRFGRLFELAETRSFIVAEMSALGWEAGEGAWVWRRQLWVWEEEM